MIDLHTHSTFSDGSETPTRVIELASAAGCSAIALTDHDGLGGLDEAAARAAEAGIGLVRGCEVSCSFEPGTLHLLCYFVPGEGPLPEKLVALRDERVRRNEQLFAKLKSLGIELSEDEVRDEAGSDVIGRPHFAAVLVRHGIVGSVGEAFDRFLVKGAPAYVERERVELAEIVALANASGAVPVVAHPLTLGLDRDELERMVSRFAAAGVRGLECYYAGYEPTVRTELAELARRHRLVATGGSDFHGSYKPGLEIGIGRGDLDVSDEVLDELASLARS